MSMGAAGTRQTILCVDDNQIHCYAITRSLQHSGYATLVAGTGAEAVAQARTNKVDLVLLDVNLPDFDGFEVCKRIKSDPQTSRIPVIFHTATSANATTSLRAEMVGGAAFLTVPIEPDELLTVIQGCLERAASDGR
jgi:CheY-like chemotaxis protein